MVLDIHLPDGLDHKTAVEFRAFLQATANRIWVGDLRYGVPHRRKRYMTRLSKELRAYRLFFDPSVASVTREDS